MRERFIVATIICMVVFLIYFVNGAQNDSQIMTIESNILSGSGGSVSNESIVMIEVPDRIYLGNVTIGEISNVSKVIIKNNGTVKPIMIQAELINPDDEIYSYLQMSNTSGSFKSLNEFSATFSTQKTIYMRLDLREFGGDIEGDLIGKKAEVRFIAMQT